MKIIPLRNDGMENLLRINTEENVKKLMVYRINRNLIGEKSFSYLNSKEIELLNNSQFYIMEIKSKNHSHKESPKNNKYLNELNNQLQTQFIYYLIRINSENVERFEIACETLKLYIPIGDRDNNAFKKSKYFFDLIILFRDKDKIFIRDSNEHLKKIKEEEYNSEELKDGFRESDIKPYKKEDYIKEKHGRLSEFNKDFLERDDIHYLNKTIKLENKDEENNINEINHKTNKVNPKP